MTQLKFNKRERFYGHSLCGKICRCAITSNFNFFFFFLQAVFRLVFRPWNIAKEWIKFRTFAFIPLICDLSLQSSPFFFVCVRTRSCSVRRYGVDYLYIFRGINIWNLQKNTNRWLNSCFCYFPKSIAIHIH